MQKVIDIRDMNTAIHSLYLVNRKPKTTLKLFKSVSTFNDENPLDEFESMGTWEQINQNVESLGEIDYRYLQGNKLWINGDLVSDVIYNDGTDQYKVIGSFDVW